MYNCNVQEAIQGLDMVSKKAEVGCGLWALNDDNFVPEGLKVCQEEKKVPHHYTNTQPEFPVLS